MVKIYEIMQKMGGGANYENAHNPSPVGGVRSCSFRLCL